jgi:hypothetical protein
MREGGKMAQTYDADDWIERLISIKKLNSIFEEL